jgi:hypothetical protein
VKSNLDGGKDSTEDLRLSQNQIHSLGARGCVLAKDSADGGGYGGCAGFFDSAHGHAKVFGFENDNGAE